MRKSADTRRRKDLSRLVRPLYGLSTLDGIGRHLAEAAGRVIGHDSLVFSEAERTTGRSAYHAQSVGGAFRDREEIIGRFLHQVPFIRHYLRSPGGPAIRTFDIVTPAEWERTELYNEGLGPLGIYEQLGAEIPSAPGTIRGLMLNRMRRGFRDRDVETFDLLKHHVAAVVAAADQWARMDRGAPNGGGRATVMLDAAGRVLFRSPETARLLESCTGPFDTALPEAVSRWAGREISRFASEELWSQPRAPLVLEKGGAALTLRLLSAEEGGGHMILIEGNARNGDPSGHHGCRCLTAREKEVLGWIAWGKTNAEISEILGTSIHTVKNHVKHILSMLGVDNRTSAVALLLQEEAER